MNELTLPRRDKNDLPYTTYSQIASFVRDPEEFYRRYCMGEPFEANPYTDFGNKVDKALTEGAYEGFRPCEQEMLRTVPRLEEFQRKIKLQYDEFYIANTIDTMTSDGSYLIDYKTGGKDKWTQYREDTYNQLDIYSLAIWQELGVIPSRAEVWFIGRGGNAFKKQRLYVSGPIIPIEKDISEESLLKAEGAVFNVVRSMGEFIRAKGKKIPPQE
jgi:hypothetical protein